MIRGSPSTIAAKRLERAAGCPCVCALASCALEPLALRRRRRRTRSCLDRGSTSTWAYQTSRCAWRRTRASPAGTRHRAEHDAWRAPSPRTRCPAPAISRLAASRLTSHSHGPGSVSSKSLMSKTRRRSGEAKMPKFDRWASPQACTVMPDARRGGEVAAIGERGAAEEGERRHRHPAVADRQQLGHPRRAPGSPAARPGPARSGPAANSGVARPRHLARGPPCPSPPAVRGSDGPPRCSAGTPVHGCPVGGPLRRRPRHRRSLLSRGGVSSGPA